ncbi:ubiquitin carboxyl-terminal hydrolase 12-like [Dorcoceras hygrometricum]|uniref:Ubiquitin carboxyl-terminal hydrolase 12-like n=1 Tax=Dorcoceras hygrometricum TaxID=472368 RepID=A0A2Z7B0M2_9LAMI|nr:ubiquitin carboxyl-terminal hydrolase 12-like [Dorcoceras hygrometricum]
MVVPPPLHDILLFFKLEPETKQLDQLCRYAGMMHVNRTTSLAGTESELKEMMYSDSQIEERT